MKLIKRYLMSHYNMTALECLPKKHHFLFDTAAQKRLEHAMKGVRLISTSEFNALCKHIKCEAI